MGDGLFYILWISFILFLFLSIPFSSLQLQCVRKTTRRGGLQRKKLFSEQNSHHLLFVKSHASKLYTFEQSNLPVQSQDRPIAPLNTYIVRTQTMKRFPIDDTLSTQTSTFTKKTIFTRMFTSWSTCLY